MQRNTAKQTLRAKICLLVLSGLLIALSGCGNANNNNSPGSPATPQSTPGNGY